MRSKIILLVEDNPDDVELTERAFKDSAVATELVVARDGAEALNYFFGDRSHAVISPTALPAVVLLDLNLPKVSGFQVLERLRADPRTKLIPVVILSSSREEVDLLRSYSLGANSYIRKPVAFEEFELAMKQLGVYWLLLNELPPARRTLPH